MLKTFQLYYREDLDEKDPWSGVLSAVMFGLRATFHTTLNATPSQLVFGRDAILPIQFQADWKYIKDRKQKLIDLNNKQENSKRIKHNYTVNEQVLMKRVKKTKHGEKEYDNPFTVLEVRNKGKC